MPYTKTTWTESTGITPERLNNLETQYDKAMDEAVTEAVQEIQYYVSTSGNDNNAGTSGAPFKTIQKAVDVAYKAIAGQVSINIAAGAYTGDIDIENMMCPKLFLFGDDENTTIINGDIEINNGQWVRLYQLQIKNGTYGIIALNGMRKLHLSSVIINNILTMGVQVDNTEMVIIENSSIGAGASAVRCTTVGTLYVRSVNFSGVQTNAIDITSGTFAYTSGLTGNIGSVPVHEVDGSILMKGTSTITGGADTKSNGGQIFEEV